MRYAVIKVGQQIFGLCVRIHQKIGPEQTPDDAPAHILYLGIASQGSAVRHWWLRARDHSSLGKPHKMRRTSPGAAASLIEKNHS